MHGKAVSQIKHEDRGRRREEKREKESEYGAGGGRGEGESRDGKSCDKIRRKCNTLIKAGHDFRNRPCNNAPRCINKARTLNVINIGCDESKPVKRPSRALDPRQRARPSV